jgi:prevent-host-death family protein
MREVTVRDLRNKGGEVLDLVEAGEEITITRDGRPVALLVPTPRRPLPMDVILARWRHLRPVDPVQFRREIDDLFDTSI